MAEGSRAYVPVMVASRLGRRPVVEGSPRRKLDSACSLFACGRINTPDGQLIEHA